MVIIHRFAAFTENGIGGNPAGVVLAEALPSREVMQQVAAEVGYSETVFSAPDGEAWRTRYFSPETEVPFCGHATIALGAALAQEKGAGTYKLSLLEGGIEVEAYRNGASYFSTLRSLPTKNAPVSPEVLTEALTLFGYPPDDIDNNLPVRRIHAGADHLHVPLRTRAALANMAYDLGEGRVFMQLHDFVTVTFTWREQDGLFHVRNAFASGGVVEDPATGAAAAAFAGMLRDLGLTDLTEHTILQGADMGRPSRISVRYSGDIGAPVFVSGTSTQIE